MNNSGLSNGNLSIGLDDLIRPLFRNKKKVLFVPLLILGLATLVIVFAPRAYRSEAKLFLQVGRESMQIDPTTTVGDTISMQSNSRDNEIITAIDTLKSRGTIEKVVDRLGPEIVLGGGDGEAAESNVVVKNLKRAAGQVLKVLKSIDPVSDRERAVVLIERNISVDAESDSSLITVQYDADNPKLAQLVMQAMIDIYREEHLRLHRTSGSKDFFTQQHAKLKKQLDTTVDRLRHAKNRLNMVSIESRRKTLEDRLGNVELSLYASLQQLAAAEARVADTKKQLAATPERTVAEETTVPNTGTDSLREQIFSLRVLMLEQQSKYSKDHPALQATQAQLEEAEAMFKSESVDRRETTQDVNPNHRSLALAWAQEESQLAGLLAQTNKLEEQRATVIADQKSINNHELEIDQLKRESQLARTNFFRYAENLEKARINEELDNNAITNAVKAQEATFAEKPVSPNKLLIGGLALLLSLSSVAVFVLIGEKLNSPIYQAQQLEETLQLPVFGVVSERRQSLSSIF